MQGAKYLTGDKLKVAWAEFSASSCAVLSEQCNEAKLAVNFCCQGAAQVCFATFIWQKITKLLITQQPLKLEKK